MPASAKTFEPDGLPQCLRKTGEHFANRKRVQERELQNEDSVIIAEHELIFHGIFAYK